MKSFSILFIASLLLSYVSSATLTNKKKCEDKCEKQFGQAEQDKRCNTKKAGRTIRDNGCYLSLKITNGNCKDRC